LDTEYRDCVTEWLMEWDDEISLLVYGKTFNQYIDQIESMVVS
jgi:hypothetical protein